MTSEVSLRSALFATAICAAGFIFDLSEIFFGNALSGVFSAPPHSVPAGQLSWLLSSVYIGAIAGPPLLGIVADRFGRRTAVMATLLLLAAASAVSALSPTIGALSLARGIAGIALGAYPPLMITYLTDTLPARLRGRLIMVTVAIAYLAPPATIFAMRSLTAATPLGVEGWRWIMAIDGAGALIAGLLARYLPEASRRRGPIEEEGQRASPPLPRFTLVAALSFLAPWAGGAFPLLSAAFLVMKGFNLSDSLFYVGVSTFGPVVGSVLVIPIADRFERRTSLLACVLVMIVSSIGFYESDNAVWLMVTGFAFNLSMALYIPALNTHVAELFSLQTRVKATTRAWSCNRLAAALVPLVMVPWLHAGHLDLVFGVIVAALAATALVVALGPRGAAGRPVD